MLFSNKKIGCEKKKKYIRPNYGIRCELFTKKRAFHRTNNAYVQMFK